MVVSSRTLTCGECKTADEWQRWKRGRPSGSQWRMDRGGTWCGVFVWDAETHDTVWEHGRCLRHRQFLTGIDETRFRVLELDSHHLGCREEIRTLEHEQRLRAAKFSSDGNEIATATRYSVQVWDNKDGHLLVDIPVMVTSLYNNGLLWFNSHIFVGRMLMLMYGGGQ